MELEKLRKIIDDKEGELMHVKEQRDDALQKKEKPAVADEETINGRAVIALRHGHNLSFRQERTENRDRGTSGVRKLDMDGLRNKLINSEIQKEGAMRMAETLREKYIKMQDILSTMMDTNKGVSERGLLLPPEPVKMSHTSRADKYIKTQKRFGLGNLTMKHVANNSSVNTSLNMGEVDSPLNISTSRQINSKANLGNTVEQPLATSSFRARDQSATKRIMKNIVQTAVTKQAQNRFNQMQVGTEDENEINLYTKELQYKKISSLSTEHPAVGLFELADKLLVDFKKDFVVYDLKRDFEVSMRREFTPQIGKVVGINEKE